MLSRALLSRPASPARRTAPIGGRGPRRLRGRRHPRCPQPPSPRQGPGPPRRRRSQPRRLDGAASGTVAVRLTAGTGATGSVLRGNRSTSDSDTEGAGDGRRFLAHGRTRSRRRHWCHRPRDVRHDARVLLAKILQQIRAPGPTTGSMSRTRSHASMAASLSPASCACRASWRWCSICSARRRAMSTGSVRRRFDRFRSTRPGACRAPRFSRPLASRATRARAMAASSSAMLRVARVGRLLQRGLDHPENRQVGSRQQLGQRRRIGGDHRDA